jgi:hypothetical protein
VSYRERQREINGRGEYWWVNTGGDGGDVRWPGEAPIGDQAVGPDSATDDAGGVDDADGGARFSGFRRPFFSGSPARGDPAVWRCDFGLFSVVFRWVDRGLIFGSW